MKAGVTVLGPLRVKGGTSLKGREDSVPLFTGAPKSGLFVMVLSRAISRDENTH